MRGRAGNTRAFIYSFSIHLAFIALLAFSFNWGAGHPLPAGQHVVQAVAVESPSAQQDIERLKQAQELKEKEEVEARKQLEANQAAAQKVQIQREQAATQARLIE